MAIFQAEILRRCMSRSAYRKLRESKIFPLPSLTALKTHLEKFGGMPEISNVFGSTNLQGAQNINNSSIKKVTADGSQLVEQLKGRSRRPSLKQININNDQEMLKIPQNMFQVSFYLRNA